MRQSSLIFLITMFFISFSANAQMTRMNPKERAEELKEKLELSDEQTKQVEEIYIKADNEIKETIQEGSRNREQLREAMETIMGNTDNEILEILNDKQKEKYNEIMQERKERMPRKLKDIN
jgi:biopolymer transport protein ExbD